MRREAPTTLADLRTHDILRPPAPAPSLRVRALRCARARACARDALHPWDSGRVLSRVLRGAAGGRTGARRLQGSHVAAMEDGAPRHRTLEAGGPGGGDLRRRDVLRR